MESIGINLDRKKVWEKKQKSLEKKMAVQVKQKEMKNLISYQEKNNFYHLP